MLLLDSMDAQFSSRIDCVGGWVGVGELVGIHLLYSTNEVCAGRGTLINGTCASNALVVGLMVGAILVVCVVCCSIDATRHRLRADTIAPSAIDSSANPLALMEACDRPIASPS